MYPARERLVGLLMRARYRSGVVDEDDHVPAGAMTAAYTLP
jgi:hypothetical protein